jgi:hypothetical protein
MRNVNNMTKADSARGRNDKTPETATEMQKRTINGLIETPGSGSNLTPELCFEVIEATKRRKNGA